jgi:hypothetical protein
LGRINQVHYCTFCVVVHLVSQSKEKMCFCRVTFKELTEFGDNRVTKAPSVPYCLFLKYSRISNINILVWQCHLVS